jgi:hypothetical protein
MTAEAELVKACFDTDLEVSTCAAVTADAGTAPGGVGEVVMTLKAVDRPMFLVREVQEQSLVAAQERLAQCKSRAARQQRPQGDE